MPGDTRPVPRRGSTVTKSRGGDRRARAAHRRARHRATRRRSSTMERIRCDARLRGRARARPARSSSRASTATRCGRRAARGSSGSLTAADYDLLDRVIRAQPPHGRRAAPRGRRAPHRQRRAEPVRRARREPVARARAPRRVRPHARGGVGRGDAHLGRVPRPREGSVRSARSRPARPRTSSSSARIRRAISPRSRRSKRSSRTGASTRAKMLDDQLARYRAYADGWLFDRISVAVTQAAPRAPRGVDGASAGCALGVGYIADRARANVSAATTSRKPPRPSGSATPHVRSAGSRTTR